eukprot:1895270-Alexandrium_andersonii.AAC.1
MPSAGNVSARTCPSDLGALAARAAACPTAPATPPLKSTERFLMSRRTTAFGPRTFRVSH